MNRRPSPMAAVALVALKHGRALRVRAILVFVPEGTNDHIRKTATVVVRLTAHHGKHGATGNLRADTGGHK